LPYSIRHRPRDARPPRATVGTPSRSRGCSRPRELSLPLCGAPARIGNVTTIARCAHRDRGLIRRRLASPITWEADARAAGPELVHSPVSDVGPRSEGHKYETAEWAAPVSCGKGRHQVARNIDWYYGDRGKIVGPMSFEDVARMINQARNEKHLVWTEGMTRWADAKTVPTFTDYFRAEPPPLPAPSLSSEDEIWIKPGSRAAPPVLPVSRGLPVLREEPSEIAQTLSAATSQGARQPGRWRRGFRQHIGSTVVLLLGALAFIGAANRIGNGDPIAPGVLKAGLVLILGALVFRSVKRRRLGEVESTSARRVWEVVAIGLMFLNVLLL
jgi:GYF domain 2